MTGVSRNNRESPKKGSVVTKKPKVSPQRPVEVTLKPPLSPLKIFEKVLKGDTPPDTSNAFFLFFSDKLESVSHEIDIEIESLTSRLDILKELKLQTHAYSVLYTIYKLKVASFVEIRDIMNFTHNQTLTRILERLINMGFVCPSYICLDNMIKDRLDLHLESNRRFTRFYSITDDKRALIRNENIAEVEKIIPLSVQAAVKQVDAHFAELEGKLVASRRQEAEKIKQKAMRSQSDFAKLYNHLTLKLKLADGETITPQTLLLSLSFIHKVFPSRKKAKDALFNVISLGYFTRRVDDKNQETLIFNNLGDRGVD